MELFDLQNLAIALGLGLLVGFQREWTGPHAAGIRTFAMLTVFGDLCGMLAGELGAWLIAAGLLSVTALIILGNLLQREESSGEDPPGLTTEVAAITMYLVGVLIAVDQASLAIVAGGGTAVLLHWKQPLHSFVSRFEDDDLRAVIQLVLIALVILPALPNRSYGPYDILNPFEIWLMVVLIVGISLGGYIALKFLGSGAGTVVAGILGGLISSTATTVSYSRRSNKTAKIVPMAALTIVIASTIVFARVLVEIALVSPTIVPQVFPPLAAMMAFMTLLSCGVYWFDRGTSSETLTDEAPSELKAAIVFGLLYAGVLFAVAAVKEHYDQQALYVVAALSGLTDMDAITLSTAQMINKGRLEADAGWRMIVIGFLSNLLFKAAAIALLGHRRLLFRVGIVFGIAFLGGTLLLILWP